MLQVIPLSAKVPHQPDQHHALNPQQQEAQPKPQENHLTGIVVHVLQRQPAQQQCQTEQEGYQHFAQLPTETCVAKRPIDPHREEYSDLNNRIEKPDDHVALQRHVHTGVRQHLITQPERDGDHQENDQPVAERIQSVQKLLVFFNHDSCASLRKSEDKIRLHLIMNP